jgi:hypothetical protein
MAFACVGARGLNMRKIIGLAALTLAASPALAADIEPKAAVEFVLSTCLPAMDDLANVEKIAQEKGWSRVSDDLPLNTEIEKSRAHWKAPEFYVITETYLLKGIYHHCFVVFRPAKVMRDAFLEAISASIELSLESTRDFPQTNFRYENYNIVGRKLKLIIASRDGIMRSASIGGWPP